MNRHEMHVAFVISRPYVGAFPCYREPIRFLADQGIKVDLYSMISDLHPVPNFLHENIRFIPMRISRTGAISLISRLVSHKPKYSWIFAVPQWDIHYAGIAASMAKIPLAYLLDEPFPEEEASTSLQKKWKERERRAHSKCALTLAFSPEGADFIRRENRLSDDHPVRMVWGTSPGPAERLVSHYYQDRFAISDRKCVLLHAGSWWWRKFFPDLEGELSRLGEDFRVVFDGRYEDRADQKKYENIHYCNTVASAEMLNYVVSSAHIGFTFYRDAPLSSRIAAGGSGKISLYLKNCLPVIVNQLDGLKWIEQEGCGICVRDIGEIKEAAAKIWSNYGWYVDNIKNVYAARLDFTKNFAAVFHEHFKSDANVESEGAQSSLQPKANTSCSG